MGPGKRGANDQERKNHKKSVTLRSEDMRICNCHCIETKVGQKHGATTLSLPRRLLAPSGWSCVHLECMSFKLGQLFCDSGDSTRASSVLGKYYTLSLNSKPEKEPFLWLWCENMEERSSE